MHKVRVVQLASMIGFVLFIASVCVLVSETEATGDTVEIGGVVYSLTESGSGDYATVVSVDSNLTTIVIPSTINYSEKIYEVRSISSEVIQNNKVITEITIQANDKFQLSINQFSGCSGLTKIVLGEGITEVPDNAFLGCSALKEVSLPSTLVTIGNSSFSGCSKLDTINWPSNLESINQSAFANCVGLTELSFGSGLKTISNGAFKGCTGLTTIEFPDSLEMIMGSSFEGCSNLAQVTFGGELNSIGTKAFYGTKITTMTIPSKVTSLGLTGSRDDAPFPTTMTTLVIDASNPKYACEGSMIIDKESDTIVYAFKVSGAVTISKNVGRQAFYGLGITSLVINEGVTSIDAMAFYQQKSGSKKVLTSVSLPSTITNIGSSAFGKNTKLTTLNLADGMKYIAGFDGCTGLVNVTLPGTIEIIDDNAFNGCTKLVTTLPSSLKIIGSSAFRDCEAMTTPVLPASLIEIGSYAFYGSKMKVCFNNLVLGAETEIKLGAYSINLKDATSLTLNKVVCDSEYDYGVIFYKDDYNLFPCTVTLGEDFKLWKWENGLGVSLDGKTAYLKDPSNTGDVVIPSSVERIVGAGFQNEYNHGEDWTITCEDPTATIVLDSAIESATSCGVFRGCVSLVSVSLPNIVVNEGRTFENCKKLNQVEISSISSFKSSMFDGTNVTELCYSGYSSIVGPIQTGESHIVLFEVPSELTYADMSLPGFDFYDISGNLIGFRVPGQTNMLDYPLQAGLIAGKVFYSPNHDRHFYEVPGDEIILVTEKSTGNTYQKIAKADRYDGITGSGQVYRIADGKALLTLHVGDELIYVAVDKGAVSDLAIPTKTGHNFEGWFTDSEYSSSFDTSAAINADQVLYAKFTINQYTITFDTAGGSAIAAITQDYDSDVTAPEAPTRTGYTFAGWSAEVPAKMPVDGMTITASWNINQYTITFDTAGGSAIAAITQDYNTSVTAPSAEPSKDGYRFVKWDSEIPASMPADNVIIKAVWAIVATVNENGKSIVTLDSETSSFIPAAETKEITVEIRENTAVKVENASDLIGKTVVSKVEPVSNSTGVSGTAYEFTFTADGTQYNGKIQVTLPYTKEAGKEPVVYYWNGSESTKMNVVSSTDTSVTFETDHNSMYVVASETPSKDDGLSFLLFFGLLMVVGIAVSMLVGFNFYRKKA